MDEADRIIGLYERHALAFDSQRGHRFFEKPWLDRFTATLSPGASILDIGCGSGEPMAAALVASGFAVTGVDSSKTLIGLCRERMPSAEWIEADMRQLALGRRFHGLMAWHSFFHLAADDQRAMFPIFAAHAAPGARLMFTSGPKAGVAMGEFEGEPLYHDSLAPEEYRRLLADNGFAVVSFTPEEPACGGATIWLAQAA
jgi:SAM-dependent methyltransferase